MVGLVYSSQLEEDSAAALVRLACWAGGGLTQFPDWKSCFFKHTCQTDIVYIFSITLYFSVFFCLYNITIVLYHVTPFRYISCLYYVLH